MTRLRLAGWSAGLVTTTWLLHRAGGTFAPPRSWSPTGVDAWAEAAGTATASLAVVRVLALVLAWYLLATTLAQVATRLAGWVSAVTVVDAVTAPALRRLVTGALAAGVALTSPAVVNLGGPPVAVAASEAAPEDGTATMRRVDPQPAPVADRPAAPPVTAPDAAPPTPRSWTVRPGDHLWGIAEAALTAAWGRPPAGTEAAPYWEQVVAANRDRLVRPDDPDLLFTGQAVLLPDPPPVPSQG